MRRFSFRKTWEFPKITSLYIIFAILNRLFAEDLRESSVLKFLEQALKCKRFPIRLACKFHNGNGSLSSGPEANRQKTTAVDHGFQLVGANPELSMEIATETYEIS